MNWINETVAVDFPVPASLQGLIAELEKLNEAGDSAYFNYAEALDDGAKELCRKGKLTQEQWDALSAKYVYA